ncbi:hypothetical protein FHS85_001425 [Rhodoligotrophos appendicifer]|uniref:hypothetical protein n=1 Tax=Rhodoligotrophos appendicifer TaxID=987056 RepID=UPI001186D030|nr:hypothetical protein [Rhodoligotrophos appendicifer]
MGLTLTASRLNLAEQRGSWEGPGAHESLHPVSRPWPVDVRFLELDDGPLRGFQRPVNAVDGSGSPKAWWLGGGLGLVAGLAAGVGGTLGIGALMQRAEPRKTDDWTTSSFTEASWADHGAETGVPGVPTGNAGDMAWIDR